MTIKHIGKFCSGAAIALVVITALGPRQLAAPHVTRLGDRPLGYFAITLPVCFAWPRPVIVGGALMVFAALLEWLQGLTPDRTSNLMAAFYGAGGVLAAALLAELFIRARRRRGG